jgi:hypothetical protein
MYSVGVFTVGLKTVYFKSSFRIIFINLELKHDHDRDHQWRDNDLGGPDLDNGLALVVRVTKTANT